MNTRANKRTRDEVTGIVGQLDALRQATASLEVGGTTNTLTAGAASQACAAVTQLRDDQNYSPTHQIPFATVNELDEAELFTEWHGMATGTYRCCFLWET